MLINFVIASSHQIFQRYLFSPYNLPQILAILKNLIVTCNTTKNIRNIGRKYLFHFMWQCQRNV
jgi:hypothetical protein